MINPKMCEGTKVRYIGNRGFIESGVVTQQYKSATGLWCLEMTNGDRVQVRFAWLDN